MHLFGAWESLMDKPSEISRWTVRRWKIRSRPSVGRSVLKTASAEAQGLGEVHPKMAGDLPSLPRLPGPRTHVVSMAFWSSVVNRYLNTPDGHEQQISMRADDNKHTNLQYGSIYPLSPSLSTMLLEAPALTDQSPSWTLEWECHRDCRKGQTKNRSEISTPTRPQGPHNKAVNRPFA